MTHFVAELKDLRRRQPFEPFRIKLKDGRVFDVTRRLQYAFSEFRVVVLDDQDRIDPFRPADIAEIELLHPVG